MGDQGSGVFLIGTYGSVTSYNNIGEGDFTLSRLSFFFVLLRPDSNSESDSRWGRGGEAARQ
jgi:hypothetical protein